MIERKWKTLLRELIDATRRSEKQWGKTPDANAFRCRHDGHLVRISRRVIGNQTLYPVRILDPEGRTVFDSAIAEGAQGVDLLQQLFDEASAAERKAALEAESLVPPPDRWEDLEDLCLTLWRRTLEEVRKHGRVGQQQAGVDIFGRHLPTSGWWGMQCKAKAGWPANSLSSREIEEEVHRAERFKPALSHFVIASTTPRDSKAQEFVLRLSDRRLRQKRFSVDLLSWNDILDELSDEPAFSSYLHDLSERSSVASRKFPTGEDEVVNEYLAQVADEHRHLSDHFARPVELQDLEKAWVRLELTQPQDTDRRAAKDWKFLEGRLGRRRLEDLLALEPEEHPWVTRRWLVEGDPGSGKTTLLRHLAARLAKVRDRNRIPVFMSLLRLVAPMRPLLDYLAEEIGTLCGPKLPEALDRAGRDGRLLVLLDGLDEVPPEYRDRVPRLLRRLESDWPKTGVVLTSRPIGRGRLPEGFNKLLLEPFDDEQRRKFLEKWFSHRQDPDAANAAAAHFDSDRSLRELSHNPLHLTLLTVLWEKGVQAPTRRSELYQAIFELLLEGRHKQPPVTIAATADVREALRHLAFGLTRDDLRAEEPEELVRRLWDNELDSVRTRLEKIWGRNLRSFLDDVYERTYLLGPHDGPHAGWRFWHRTFREALTAEKLKELLEKDEAALFKQLTPVEGQSEREELGASRRELFLAFHQGDEGRWSEPFALLAGHLADPNTLVRSLAKANRSLGLRAVATAQSLRDETVNEILELSEEWLERTKVYESLPELMDDPLRALALLDLLRQRTRNGNDLFFLEKAVVSVSEKSPDARRAAEQLRERFYDHIPPPPEELFQWIETRDGRVELWREIPAGRFRMGSLEYEKDRLQWEGPQHEVRIVSPFRMAAVPVTVAQYAAFDPEHRSHHQGKVLDEKLATHAVKTVTWYQAFAFCRWLSASLPWAEGARLPTEEEWEYACRGGSESRYWSGDEETDLSRVGWYDANSDDRTHRVGRKLANPWGLYDVHGNVWEWTLSERSDNYSGRESGVEVDPAAVDPADPAASSAAERVARGGSYGDLARAARSAYRSHRLSGIVYKHLGFRVCLPAAADGT